MDYHLPNHVSFGIVGCRAVILDLKADRYFLLGSDETDALCAINNDEEQGVPGQSIKHLLARGFLRVGKGPHICPAGAPELQASALETHDVDGSLPFLEAANYRWQTGAMLHVCGLAKTIGYWRHLRNRFARRSSLHDRYEGQAAAQAASIARGYQRARLLIPLRRLCVAESLALARSLWRRGIEADVYFGARMFPFAAHAWVQYDSLLLSDPISIVTDYQPVFRL